MTDDQVGEARRLAERLGAGQPDALDEIYRANATLVHSLALRSLGTHHDAEDATQQVFVAAWRSRHTLRPERGSVTAWLIGITRNVVADMHAQRARHARNTQVLGEQATTEAPRSMETDVTDRLVVRQALGALGDPRAAIVRMAFLQERTHEEIAADLQLPLGTVKSHVRRGLLQVRSQLKEVRESAS